MPFYAARQPILDKDKQLVAYELLFRDSLDNVFPDIDPAQATSQIIAESELAMGLEDLTGKHPAFINFTLETLIKKFPSLLPSELLVVEVLETEAPTKRLLSEVQELKENGYTVALDDYEHSGAWRHFFPYVDIIKVDFQACNEEMLKQVIEETQLFPNIRLLAEKIETYQEFNQALNLGFSLFQGYFFAEPELVQSRSMSPSQVAMAELLYETSQSEIQLQNIIGVFERDVTLAYKLLRYSNSAAFKRGAEIETIKQALIVLGQAELKKFISLLFTAKLNPEKPQEITQMAMIRARFCELLAQKHGMLRDTAMAFLCGMLSLVDALLDEPVESIMEKLPVATEIKQALMEDSGILAEYLQIIKAYEKADWLTAAEAMKSLKLDEEILP